MQKSDLEKYTENLEEIILQKERKLEEFKGQAKLADLYQCAAQSLKECVGYLKRDTSRLFEEFRKVLEDRSQYESSSEDPDQKQKIILDKMNSRLDRVESQCNIISELLASMQSGLWSIPVKKDPIDLNDIIIKWTEYMEAHVMFSPNTKLILQLKSSIPRVAMRESEFFQIVNNLARNSIEALEGKEDGILLLKTDILDDNILFEVIDNGCGITQKTAGKIFKPFFSAKQSPLSKSKHLGLGLYTVARIVEANNGKMEFESEPDVKTSFRVFLSVCKTVKASDTKNYSVRLASRSENDELTEKEKK